MADLFKSETLKENPIGRGLDPFHNSFSATCARFDHPESVDTVQHFSNEAARSLRSSGGRGTLSGNLGRLASVVDADDFDVTSTVSLVTHVINKAPDAIIWGTVYDLITESTPPPRQLPYPHQTPISFNTGSFVNTSENRKHFDGALKNEPDSSLYIDVPGFFDAFFGEVANLSSVADTVLRKCQGWKDPLYNEEEGSWRDWPKDAKEEQVLK